MRSVRIPIGGSYRVEATGAAAADVHQPSGYVYHGGHGATVAATFSLREGDVLVLLCAGMCHCYFRLLLCGAIVTRLTGVQVCQLLIIGVLVVVEVHLLSLATLL